MKKILKRIFLGLVVLFVAIQFIRPEKNIAAAPGPNDILALHPAPAEVRQLLTTACYDCHSNNTRYPWYAEVQPIGLWLADHVKHGKSELNFSEFGAFPKKRAIRKMEQSVDEVAERHMPIKAYRLVHPGARLTDAQIKMLSDWFDSVREKVEQQ